MTVSELLEQPCNKSDNTIKLILHVFNNLFQTCYNKLGMQYEHILLTTCEQTCYNLFADL